MRKLILQMQMSVDGRVSADDGIAWQVWNWNWNGAWPWDDALKQAFNDSFATADCILLSRPMAAQGYIDHWTRAAAANYPADPHYAFARKIVDADKVVVSGKLDAAPWPHTRIASRGLALEVEALKREAGGDILCFGGAGFASALIAAGLVDEFQFYVNPTAVGRGRSIFPDRGLALRLLGSQAYDCGIVVARYRPADAD
ncbi:dihydrofolate reductase family protein [Lysobacter antibioticus]|uniref:RibD C-terminal domain protein n=1 Tax=Lysobacter antibioticus TaxID=84531 RepID=A0A0S2FA07_LYSAN|nr:dihydrofolate reductase family protein [Lysobacter antibioticus]ALN80378.1 ribD C-terminal domain protein [Lysobacter antibioticus]